MVDYKKDEIVHWLNHWASITMNEGNRDICVAAADRIVELEAKIKDLEEEIEDLGHEYKNMADRMDF